MHILESLLWQRKKIAEHLLLGRQTYKVIGYIRLRVGDRDFEPVGYVPFPLDRQIGCKRWESGCANQFIKCRYLFPGRESGYPAFFLHSFSKTDIRAKKHGFPIKILQTEGTAARQRMSRRMRKKQMLFPEFPADSSLLIYLERQYDHLISTVFQPFYQKLVFSQLRGNCQIGI